MSQLDSVILWIFRFWRLSLKFLLIFWILIFKVFSFSVNSACDLFCSGYGCGTQKVLPRLIVKLSTLFKTHSLRKCMWHFSRKITHYFPERKHCTRYKSSHVILSKLCSSSWAAFFSRFEEQEITVVLDDALCLIS